ncbi:hypothetical protein [Phycicoccus sonneratiae]|uniref:PH domain-containing protein n=1 Tax=Phycicoccus sonneratiae TaxID=2807628 RepID=A0ABS2CPV7_9MICO|nr:hypothetical protein [Phycicoccus sonneraticus]MBM6401930.1 hypothetical protein [Phycicoccus sonneraticus]
MDSATEPLVGRPHSSRRFAQAVVGAIALVIGVALLVKGTWFAGAALTLLGLYGLTDLRRKATVTRERLVVQGRVVRRDVALADLVRVTLSPASRPWVALRDGRSFYVRMVSPFHDLRHPGVHDFVGGLRERADAAGAELTAEGAERSPAPPGTSPLFSA